MIAEEAEGEEGLVQEMDLGGIKELGTVGGKGKEHPVLRETRTG